VDREGATCKLEGAKKASIRIHQKSADVLKADGGISPQKGNAHQPAGRSRSRQEKGATWGKITEGHLDYSMERVNPH